MESFVGLNSDFYLELSMSRPGCPDCDIPVWQYSTLRYGRLVNRSIIDELLQTDAAARWQE